MTKTNALPPLPRARRTAIAPGLTVALPIRYQGLDGGVLWTMDIDLVDGRLACSQLAVERDGEGPPVTGEALRKIPIAACVARAVRENGTVVEATGQAWTQGRPDDFPDAGPTEDALRYVARCYLIEQALGGKPTRAIEELGLARSTAERWIRTARAKGYLDEGAVS